MVPVIVVPILNRPDLLDRCLKSIDYPVETLIVIDNGGVYDADMMSWVVDRQIVKNSYVWSFPSNLGVATSWNLGIKSTPFADGWILLNSDAWFEPGQLEAFYKDCEPNNITLNRSMPAWCCAWVGSQVVERVGLFCESFHPAYFEDTDWQERATRINTVMKVSQAGIGHDNSSTIRSDDSLADKNAKSFQANQELYALRWQSGVPDAGHWDLKRRRELGWD
jgi:GT2 family glycosyltransferase